MSLLAPIPPAVQRSNISGKPFRTVFSLLVGFDKSSITTINSLRRKYAAPSPWSYLMLVQGFYVSDLEKYTPKFADVAAKQKEFIVEGKKPFKELHWGHLVDDRNERFYYVAMRLYSTELLQLKVAFTRLLGDHTKWQDRRTSTAYMVAVLFQRLTSEEADIIIKELGKGHKLIATMFALRAYHRECDNIPTLHHGLPFMEIPFTGGALRRRSPSLHPNAQSSLDLEKKPI